jgi:endonuclease/exonuclease/phosphatase family metal-dependent hydrolase
LSRTHWAARLLGIQAPKGETDEPGLVMIQIDGLSRSEFERALGNGRLPFLARLIRRGHFTLESFYSGLPSTTPAVQGEIFFGIRTAVPSFEFMRRKTGKVFRMYESTAAAEIQEELAKRCPDPLLQRGRAYLDIYRGGADFSHYCSQDTAMPEVLRQLNPVKWLILSTLYAPKILRMIALVLLELGLAVVDAFRGVCQRHAIFNEVGFVPARVFFSILLRELIRFRVMLDIENGVQVIHANFVGYDEQAHRRGPDSAFAHWTLKGIDSAIRDICRVAGQSTYRDYEWIVYSDHGQERTVPYATRHGRGIDEAVREVFSSGSLAGREIWMSRLPEVIGNTRDRWRRFLGLKPASHEEAAAPDPATQIVISAMGPVGHLYLPENPPPAEMESYAHELVKTAGIPLVLLPGPHGVRAFNRGGAWKLPEDRAEILGPAHPYLDEAAADLVALCQHPDAGDFVISGWDYQETPLSFPMENGAHAGPGAEETRGFLLVPDRIQRWHVAHLANTRNRVRGEDLRKIAMHFLGRDGTREERVAHHRARDQDLTIRVMTYNIHSCRGLDGKVRPERVARVINHFDPDVVAVQEVDSHRFRSGGHDQSQLIADHLRMSHVFHAMFEEERERYGIAIFSKFPFTIVKAAHLTGAVRRIFREARGAIWVQLEFDGRRPFHFINTHFGLGGEEKRRQAEQLLGRDWLGDIPEGEPVILCGDFNSGPRSTVFRRLQQRFSDVQLAADNHKPRSTFTSMKPFMRIDHIFVSSHFTVERVELPDTPTAVMASDHLPLCAELTLPARHETS